MSLTEFLFGGKPKVTMGSLPTSGGVGFVQLDCSVSETHTDTAEITSHPVEDGSLTTDHIRKLPNSLEINGIVTNTPITYLASLFAKPPTFASQGFIPSTPASNRVDDAYSLMQQMMANGVTMTVVTSLRNYENMAIESLVVTREAATGNVLDCVITLREVQKAKALSIDLPIPENPANNVPSEQGNVSTQGASAAQETSMAAQAVDFGSGLLGF
jgi:hypothetical protein